MGFNVSAYAGPNIVQKALTYWRHDVPPKVKKVLKVAIPIFLVLTASAVGVAAAFLSPLALAPTIAGAAMLGSFALMVGPPLGGYYLFGKSYGTELLKAQHGLFTPQKQTAFQNYGKYCTDLDFSVVQHPRTVQALDKACDEAAEIIKACPLLKKVNLSGIVNQRLLNVIEKSSATKLEINLSNQINNSVIYANHLPSNLKHLTVNCNKSLMIPAKFFENVGKHCSSLKNLSCSNFNHDALKHISDYPKLKNFHIQTRYPHQVFSTQGVTDLKLMKQVEKITIVYNRKKLNRINDFERKRLREDYLMDINQPPWGAASVTLRRRTLPI